MASTGVNVLRYSALGAGLIYGFLHQSKLSSAAKLSSATKEYQHREALIAQAKAEYAKKFLPSSLSSSSNEAKLDPNNSNFDLEAFLMKMAAEDS